MGPRVTSFRRLGLDLALALGRCDRARLHLGALDAPTDDERRSVERCVDERLDGP